MPVYDLRSKEKVAYVYNGHPEIISSFVVSPDDQRIITSSGKYIYIRSTSKYFVMEKISPINPVSFDSQSHITFTLENYQKANKLSYDNPSLNKMQNSGFQNQTYKQVYGNNHSSFKHVGSVEDINQNLFKRLKHEGNNEVRYIQIINGKKIIIHELKQGGEGKKNKIN